MRSGLVLIVVVATAVAPARAQQLTLAELDGALIEVTVVKNQVVRRRGTTSTGQTRNDAKIVIGPGELIQQTVTPTWIGSRGARQGKVLTDRSRIGQVIEVRSLGGGQLRWTFSDGVLTFLRTYKTGALKREIVFARSSDGGLACTVSEASLREKSTDDATHHALLESPIDGAAVAIVSSTQVSSSCRVTKR